MIFYHVPLLEVIVEEPGDSQSQTQSQLQPATMTCWNHIEHCITCEKLTFLNTCIILLLFGIALGTVLWFLIAIA